MARKDKGYLTSSDLAKMFKISVGSVKNWTDDNTIKNVSRTAGGHRRYTQDHVDQLKEILNRQPATAVKPTEHTAETNDAT
jgi:DNA-binding transcriptional MerR regulator